MRGAIAVTAAVAMLGAFAHAWAAPRPAALGYDHLLHERDVDINGGAAIACAHCHAVQGAKIIGRPGHAACFGACHGAAPIAPKRGAHFVLDADRTKLCTTCHAETALLAPYAGTLAVPYPPYALDPDFALAFGHRSHRDGDCLHCHDDPARKATPVRAPADAHRRCASCHDGAPGHASAMSACLTCHTPAGGKPRPPTLADATITVTSTFSHAHHAARSTAGKTCTSCHAAIRDTDNSSLPRPTTATCATTGCHDGAAAFAVTLACTRCHRDAPVGTYAVERPTARFSHAQHGPALAAVPCASCHPLGTRGEIEVAGHAACTTCHAADFGAAKPRICGACHTSSEPWRTLTADQRPAERTEFGATLDHAKHPATCATCHALTTATQQLRPPRGHAACTGTSCHAIASGPAPLLTACTSCHQQGAAAARELARATATWSVRTAFDHRAHRTTPGGAALACTACHTDLGGGGLLALPTPAKATCAPCHDGAAAFSLTGTTCTRCHAGR